MESTKEKKKNLGGRPPGPITLERRLELRKRKVMETMIYHKTAPLIRAGISNALGQNFVYRIDEERDNKGKLLGRKHILVTDSREIAKALDQIEDGGSHPDDKYYYVTAKEPDIRAIEMLLNRGYGKPKETVTLNGEVTFSLKTLMQARKEIKDEPLEIDNISVEE